MSGHVLDDANQKIADGCLPITARTEVHRGVSPALNCSPSSDTPLILDEVAELELVGPATGSHVSSLAIGVARADGSSAMMHPLHVAGEHRPPSRSISRSIAESHFDAGDDSSQLYGGKPTASLSHAPESAAASLSSADTRAWHVSDQPAAVRLGDMSTDDSVELRPT
jgi:hypothetical protein